MTKIAPDGTSVAGATMWMQVGNSHGFLKKAIGTSAEIGRDQREELISSWVKSIDLAKIQSTIMDIMDLGKRVNQCGLAADISLRLIRRWAQNDVMAASKWVQHLPRGAMRQDALLCVTEEWAKQV